MSFSVRYAISFAPYVKVFVVLRKRFAKLCLQALCLARYFVALGGCGIVI